MRPGRHLDVEILEQASAYRFNDYISERLSVVTFAVDRWEALTKSDPSRKRTARPAEHHVKATEQLRRELRTWGIDSGSEQEAIVDFVIWPRRIVDFNKELKEMKSQQSNRTENAKRRPGSP